MQESFCIQPPPVLLRETMESSGPDSLPARRGGQSKKAAYSYDGATGWQRWRALRPGRGMYHDVRRRLPYYGSDFRDALTYPTVASTIRMYFVK